MTTAILLPVCVCLYVSGFGWPAVYVVFAVCTAAADRTERTSNEEVHNMSSSSSGNSTNYSLISLHINQIAHTFTAPPLPFCTLYIVNEPMMTTTTTTSTTMGTESPGLPLTRAKPLFLSPISERRYYYVFLLCILIPRVGGSGPA